MTTKPMVYSCSGCSNVAQLANSIAVKLDRNNIAEMSCIAGVGGNVKSLCGKLNRAQRHSRKIIALDGCPLACVKSCLKDKNIAADVHIDLSQTLSLKKSYQSDFNAEEITEYYENILSKLPLHTS